MFEEHFGELVFIFVVYVYVISCQIVIIIVFQVLVLAFLLVLVLLLLLLLWCKGVSFVGPTGPVTEGKILDGTKEGEDIDIQQSRTHIEAHWSAFEDLESDIFRVTWCAGLSPGSCDLVDKAQLAPTSTSVHKVLIEPLKNGQRYFITVNAANGAGIVTSLKSDGVTVDDTPPTYGIVIDGNSTDVNYVNGEQDISARWFNFEDLESGIESYEIALCDARNLSFCIRSFTGVGQATNVTITGMIYLRCIYIKYLRSYRYASVSVFVLFPIKII